VLIQLFEITAIFDMRLRPELVLLQKTMMTVEGVARRIYPEHDIWAAADPVVRRWMLRELSPAARAKRYADEAVSALRNLARMIETPRPAEPPPSVEEEERASALLWFALGAVAAGAAFLLAAFLR
jgi:ubiquinone biosynthesis protein